MMEVPQKNVHMKSTSNFPNIYMYIFVNLLIFFAIFYCCSVAIVPPFSPLLSPAPFPLPKFPNIFKEHIQVATLGIRKMVALQKSGISAEICLGLLWAYRTGYLPQQPNVAHMTGSKVTRLDSCLWEEKPLGRNFLQQWAI